MRNILLFGCLLLCANICKAQFQKGQKLIGGQIGFSSASDEFTYNSPGITQNTSFSFAGSVTRFKSPQVANSWGVSYQYYYNHANIDNPGLEQLSHQHSIGLFVAKTRLLPLARKLDLAFTGTGGIGYTFGNRTYSTNGATADIEAITPYVSGSLGIWYQLSKRLVLSCDFLNLVSLSYSYSTTKLHSNTSDGKYNSNHFNLNAGLNGTQLLNGLFVGVRYVLK